MQTPTLDSLRYPIGKYKTPETITAQHIEQWISDIEAHPALLCAAVKGLTDQQLDTPYRPEGWTIRQVVHHVPDSHANSYIRFKWSLTEENPTIKAYHEDRWAELGDGKHAPIELSLDFLESLHKRWVYFLRTFSEEDWKKSFRHPATGKDWPLKWTVGLYAWHGKHHLAHITELKKRMGWD